MGSRKAPHFFIWVYIDISPTTIFRTGVLLTMEWEGGDVWKALVREGRETVVPIQLDYDWFGSIRRYLPFPLGSH